MTRPKAIVEELIWANWMSMRRQYQPPWRNRSSTKEYVPCYDEGRIRNDARNHHCNRKHHVEDKVEQACRKKVGTNVESFLRVVASVSTTNGTPERAHERERERPPTLDSTFNIPIGPSPAVRASCPARAGTQSSVA